jgi:hypothetical protein
VSSDATIRDLARRYVWWQTPEETTARPSHFLCHLMQLGTSDDVRRARQTLGDEAFRDALSSAPPGVLDPQSWNYWHLVLFKAAPPPQPARPLPP